MYHLCVTIWDEVLLFFPSRYLTSKKEKTFEVAVIPGRLSDRGRVILHVWSDSLVVRRLHGDIRQTREGQTLKLSQIFSNEDQISNGSEGSPEERQATLLPRKALVKNGRSYSGHWHHLKKGNLGCRGQRGHGNRHGDCDVRPAELRVWLHPSRERQRDPGHS